MLEKERAPEEAVILKTMPIENDLVSMSAVPSHFRFNGVVFDLLGPRLVHIHHPIVDRLPIHPSDGCLGFRVATPFDESESARYPGVAIGNNFYTQHVPECLEGRP